MKKRIIKSYFFKQNANIKLQNNVFCFSKRGVKIRKQLRTHLQLNSYKHNSNPTFTLYKQYTLNYIIYPKVLSLKNSAFKYYIGSWFKNKSSTTTHSFTKLNQLFYLYMLNKTLIVKLSKTIPHYTNTGLLSSHFVHFLLTKNLSYQTRSKYKTDINNMGSTYYYMYMYTKILSHYTNTLKHDLYFFTQNIAKQQYIIDSDFNITYTHWNNTIKSSPSNYPIILNSNSFNTSTIDDLFKNLNNIKQYLIESDTARKEQLFSQLNFQNDDVTSIMSIAPLFSKNAYFVYESSDLILKKKLYSINNSDI